MVQESTIRRMTRLAHAHNAVNLSQGFPNEPPPWELRVGLAHAVLTGQSTATLATAEAVRNVLDEHEDAVRENDELNQYSPPMGRLDLRQAIVDYYERVYGFAGIDAATQVTITLGATEAVACALRAVTRPGDRVVILEPFHELYPSQCRSFYLEPVCVRLRAGGQAAWEYDPLELEDALRDSKVLLLNSPHNPTGKVFTYEELQQIVDWCIQYDVFIITDEIYEHMCFHDRHYVLPHTFPQAADRILVCNSLGKSAAATGWRLGWCIHPTTLSQDYRAIHDQLTVMSPHPMQYAARTFFAFPVSHYRNLATKYQERVDVLTRLVTAVGLGVVVPPAAAYYLLVTYDAIPALRHKTPMEAAEYMVEHIGVACVPADAFYQDEAPRYLRLAACRTLADLETAGLRLERLLLDVDADETAITEASAQKSEG